MALKLTDTENYSGIADAIRDKRNIQGAGLTGLYPRSMAGQIKAIRLGVPVNVNTHINPITGEWERPSDMPDLDAIRDWQDNSDFEGVYLTYDNTGELPKVCGFYCLTDTGGLTIERGHISNGAFVVDWTDTFNSSTYYEHSYDGESSDSYIIYRVRPTTGHITRFYFGKISTAIGIKVALKPYEQACLERVGCLPYLNNTYYTNNYTHTACYMERDGTIIGKNVNGSMNLSCMFYSGYNLVKCDGLEKSAKLYSNNWSVTTLLYAWNSCYSLQSLDLSGWDTSNWSVTTLQNAWQNCYSLQVAKISTILYTNTSNVSYPSGSFLTDYYPPTLYASQNYSSCYKLTKTSLLRILNALPTITTTYTLTLGTLKNKLTDNEIAIATQKGWSIV